jgi:uncharacterized short protein YbdD (DUF466 family)
MSENCLLLKAPRPAALLIQRCHPLFVVEPRPKSALQWLKLVGRRAAQSFRLMVGVQDYGNYVAHFRVRHPRGTPLSEREFHRRCLEARFPSEGGKMGKCPC